LIKVTHGSHLPLIGARAERDPRLWEVLDMRRVEQTSGKGSLRGDEQNPAGLGGAGAVGGVGGGTRGGMTVNPRGGAAGEDVDGEALLREAPGRGGTVNPVASGIEDDDLEDLEIQRQPMGPKGGGEGFDASDLTLKPFGAGGGGTVNPVAGGIEDEWAWMKNYRVSGANQKDFLYPENHLENWLRDDLEDLETQQQPMGPKGGGETHDAAAANQDDQYVVYRDVWDKSVQAAEDSAIREVALGGPETTTRAPEIQQPPVVPAGRSTIEPLDRGMAGSPAFGGVEERSLQEVAELPPADTSAYLNPIVGQQTEDEPYIGPPAEPAFKHDGLSTSDTSSGIEDDDLEDLEIQRQTDEEPYIAPPAEPAHKYDGLSTSDSSSGIEDDDLEDLEIQRQTDEEPYIGPPTEPAYEHDGLSTIDTSTGMRADPIINPIASGEDDDLDDLEIQRQPVGPEGRSTIEPLDRGLTDRSQDQPSNRPTPNVDEPQNMSQPNAIVSRGGDEDPIYFGQASPGMAEPSAGGLQQGDGGGPPSGGVDSSSGPAEHLSSAHPQPRADAEQEPVAQSRQSMEVEDSREEPPEMAEPVFESEPPPEPEPAFEAVQADSTDLPADELAEDEIESGVPVDG
jgi:hypothetical protein